MSFDRQKYERIACDNLLQKVLCDKNDVTFAVEQSDEKIVVTAQVVLQKKIDTY